MAGVSGNFFRDGYREDGNIPGLEAQLCEGSCEVCDELQRYANEFFFNGLTTNVRLSLCADNGLGNNESHNNCEDVKDLLECYLKELEAIAPIYKDCDGRVVWQLLHHFLHNQGIVNDVFAAWLCCVQDKLNVNTIPRGGLITVYSTAVVTQPGSRRIIYAREGSSTYPLTALATGSPANGFCLLAQPVNGLCTVQGDIGASTGRWTARTGSRWGLTLTFATNAEGANPISRNVFAETIGTDYAADSEADWFNLGTTYLYTYLKVELYTVIDPAQDPNDYVGDITTLLTMYKGNLVLAKEE